MTNASQRLRATRTFNSRDQQARARRDQIVETALRLFARYGFDGTSTKQIAQAAGIAEGLIFHYFRTKADLLNAVLETRHSFAGELRDLLVDSEARPAREVLGQIACEWLETLRREREITLVMLSAAQTNPQVGDALRQFIADGILRLAGYLQARVKAGELRPDLPVETSAQAFLSSFIVFFMRNHALSKAEWNQRAQVFTREMLSIWLDN
ncbi:MAG: helix-turn-helix domain-containing protein [Chloroflexota bacterium]